MCISARDDSLSWPMHALLYVCSRLKELALLSHSQLVAGIVAHILRSVYIFGKRSSSHSLRASAAVFGLSRAKHAHVNFIFHLDKLGHLCAD